jgi:hypothetical protein
MRWYAIDFLAFFVSPHGNNEGGQDAHPTPERASRRYRTKNELQVAGMLIFQRAAYWGNPDAFRLRFTVSIARIPIFQLPVDNNSLCPVPRSVYLC